jgi:uncharacterized protein YbjT (DUF2867 family)
MTGRTALLLGATGLVGAELLSLLLREAGISTVVALLRRPLDLGVSPKLLTRVVDFDALERDADAFRTDLIFCALGTTMRQAGTQERFRRVDYDYPVMAASLGAKFGTSQYLLVSALGADARSRVYYNRVKGETEEAIRSIGIPSVTIARPSLLVGPRKEFRFGERLGQLVGLLAPPSIRPIPARDVAAALTLGSRQHRSGCQILASRDMRGAYERLLLASDL